MFFLLASAEDIKIKFSYKRRKKELKVGPERNSECVTYTFYTHKGFISCTKIRFHYFGDYGGFLVFYYYFSRIFVVVLYTLSIHLESESEILKTLKGI